MPTDKKTPIEIKNFATEKEFLDWLNESPRIEKENPDGSKYVPISCVQEDLFSGFRSNTKFELLRENIFNNGLSGVGRLHYKHPLSGEWLFQDGSAAIGFSGGLRLDFPSLSGHIMLSCAKKIGERFGQSLNRDLEDAPATDTEKVSETISESPDDKKIKLLISKCESAVDLGKIKKQVPKHLVPLYMQKIKSFRN